MIDIEHFGSNLLKMDKGYWKAWVFITLDTSQQKVLVIVTVLIA